MVSHVRARLIIRARCPWCRELFVPENGLLPTHYLDLWAGNTKCEGSGKPATLQTP
jgi:hypothetical protein